MHLETVRLRVQFKDALPKGTWPEHVRKVALGILDDQHPTWPVVCNHRMIYPRLHYNTPDQNSFYFTGLGTEGKDAVLALAEAFQRSSVVLAGKPMPLKAVDMRYGECTLKPTTGLQRFTLRTPIHMFEHHNRFRERTGDVARDYQVAFKRHFGWLFQQFDLDLKAEPVVEVRDIKEAPLQKKSGWSKWPALVRATIITNLSLPPAIGHGVGLGWGQLQWHRGDAMYA
ncbi:MAG: hypothetical protein KKB70_08975 [Proteobacteria bacterium]|nr:hypothetical protein [Pseudomonadota bacterium]MBU1610704.1 hypothetical protein [Pseudomonadota bacterium]